MTILFNFISYYKDFLMIFKRDLIQLLIWICTPLLLCILSLTTLQINACDIKTMAFSSWVFFFQLLPSFKHSLSFRVSKALLEKLTTKWGFGSFLSNSVNPIRRSGIKEKFSKWPKATGRWSETS